MKLLVLAALLALTQQSSVNENLVSPVEISVETIDGTRWWSVRARNVALTRVLGEIGSVAGRRVEGLGPQQRVALVSVDLEKRPLEIVLEYTLGSIGLGFDLRRDAIEVRPVVPLDVDQDELLTQASATWLRATTRFPAHRSAPSARLAQGEIAELQGNLGAARNHYQTLIESYPSSSMVDEAYLRSGRILKREGRWADASLQFRALANRSTGREYHSVSRLELARCSIELGNPEDARYLLDALDVDFGTDDPVELTERLLIRAQALNGLGRHMEALRTLDKADANLDPLGRRAAWRIRARGLEGVGLPIEAGRAWLLYARDATGDERVQALVRSTRLALDAGDEIGALFVCREAELAGTGEPLRALRQEARDRLGLDPPRGNETTTLEQRIGQAEVWIEQGRLQAAAKVFDSLYLGRAALEPELGVRVAIGWARCVESREGLEQALRILSETRAGLGDAAFAVSLDLAAAGLCESNELFDEAIAAYAGSY